MCGLPVQVSIERGRMTVQDITEVLKRNGWTVRKRANRLSLGGSPALWSELRASSTLRVQAREGHQIRLHLF